MMMNNMQIKVVIATFQRDIVANPLCNAEVLETLKLMTRGKKNQRKQAELKPITNGRVGQVNGQKKQTEQMETVAKNKTKTNVWNKRSIAQRINRKKQD